MHLGGMHPKGNDRPLICSAQPVATKLTANKLLYLILGKALVCPEIFPG